MENRSGVRAGPAKKTKLELASTDAKNNKLSYGWETVRRESMPRIAEMDMEMTT